MSRLQLALNVKNLDAAVDFYSKLFATEAAKLRSGYANFAIANPPLKLVLFENPSADEKLNHLGVEVETSTEVGIERERLEQLGLATRFQEKTTCCHAIQDKAWVTDPDGDAWEVYTVLEDSDSLACGGKTQHGHC